MNPSPVRFQDLEASLRDALNHLKDPDFDPPDLLHAVWRSEPGDGPGPIQAAIIRAIDALKPGPETPRQAEARRAHEILQARYLLGLTLDETATQLSLSIRHLTRLQREAIHSLALSLWERARAAPTPDGTEPSRRPPTEPYQQPEGWRDQVREELAVLDRGEADAKCSLAVAIPRALRVAQTLAQGRTIGFSANAAPLEPKVLIHSSTLQHILLSATDMLVARLADGGRVWWRAERCQGAVRLRIEARPIDDGELRLPESIIALLAPHGGTAEIARSGGLASVSLWLPSDESDREKVVVLAIDDNAGLVSLFQTYCTGTAYEVVHVAEGHRALEAVNACQPQVILLDVLLPDVDGWALLVELREALPSAVPIILCSVTRDEQLALRLGADMVLPKPVWRDQLLGALDRALGSS